MTKANLDHLICDVEQNAINTETYREFMVWAFCKIYGDDARIPNFDDMSDEELNCLLDDLDYLLEK